MCCSLFHLKQNLGLSDDVRKNQGQNECKETVSSPQHEVDAWNSFPKDVMDLNSLHGFKGRTDKCLKGDPWRISK